MLPERCLDPLPQILERRFAGKKLIIDKKSRNIPNPFIQSFQQIAPDLPAIGGIDQVFEKLLVHHPAILGIFPQTDRPQPPPMGKNIECISQNFPSCAAPREASAAFIAC